MQKEHVGWDIDWCDYLWKMLCHRWKTTLTVNTPKCPWLSLSALTITYLFFHPFSKNFNNWRALLSYWSLYSTCGGGGGIGRECNHLTYSTSDFWCPRTPYPGVYLLFGVKEKKRAPWSNPFETLRLLVIHEGDNTHVNVSKTLKHSAVKDYEPNFFGLWAQFL